MCLLVFARNSHPEYPLVVVANRDEYHNRPAEAAHWWPQVPQMLAGRDLQAGGTWMGVNKHGQWAALTNYREGIPEPAPRSRGELVAGFLAKGGDPAAYLHSLDEKRGDYGGFSLVLGSPDQLYYYTNRRAGIQQIGDGIHTLSNHLLNTPWPKAELARLKLNRLLHHTDLELDDLFAVLADHEPFADHELPATGVGLEMERVLSPPFISGDPYGTRCTTVLRVDRTGQAVYAEQSFRPNGIRAERVTYVFAFGGKG